VTSGGNNFNDFPDNQLTKFHVFIGRSRIYIPLNFYEALRFVSPIGWTPLTDTMDKEINERTTDASLCPPLRSSVIKLKTHGVENRRRFSIPCVFSLRLSLTLQLSHISPSIWPVCHVHMYNQDWNLLKIKHYTESHMT